MAATTLRRLVTDTAFALGALRAVVHSAFLVGVLSASFINLSALPVTVLRPTGAMQLVPWSVYEALLTPAGMTALKVSMTAALLAGAVGLWTPLTTKLAAALVLFYQGLLRSFGHFNHDEMVAVYALIVLAFAPCGDGFSLGTRRRRAASAGWIYGYPIFLVRLLVAWMYFSSGLIKLRVEGLGYFNPDNLPVLAVSHSLDNLHDTQYRFAFALATYRDFTTPLVAAVLLWELVFPLAIFWPRVRWWLIGFGVIFHVSTIFAMNLFFPYHLVMYMAFVNWQAGAVASRRWWERWRPLKRSLFGSSRVPVDLSDGAEVIGKVSDTRDHPAELQPGHVTR